MRIYNGNEKTYEKKDVQLLIRDTYCIGHGYVLVHNLQDYRTVMARTWYIPNHVVVSLFCYCFLVLCFWHHDAMFIFSIPNILFCSNLLFFQT